MKARFSQPQLPVKTVATGGKTYIFICLNETQGTESYPDMGEGQAMEAYYEYDYNEIVGPTDKLPMDDIQASPENYLDYEYTEKTDDPGEKALESVIRYVRNKMLSEVSEMDDKTEAIACKGLIPVYEQNHSYSVGDVRLHPRTGNPKECILAYDGSIQPDWTIDTATLWKPWHSRKKEYALPWEAPIGAHDMYKAGEYMVWTDGNTYRCKQDTNFSPEEYTQAWENA